MYAEPDEPLTIDAGVVADYLGRMRKPQMASFVRHLNSRVTEANQTEMRLRKQCQELFQRLQRYEPRDTTPVHCPTPPPEASD